MVSSPEVEEYVAGLPDAARPVVQRIQELVREHDPGLTETIRYGIPTFRREDAPRGRNVLHVAGYAGHVSIHPRPDTGADEALAAAVAPYASGKGTLRFPLSEPLPEDVVRRVVAALVAP